MQLQTTALATMPPHMGRLAVPQRPMAGLALSHALTGRPEGTLRDLAAMAVGQDLL